jgi:hypothetical protein
MELERDVLVPPTGEVPVIEGELVAAIRELAGRGIGSKTIARTVGVARNTVKTLFAHTHRARDPGSASGAEADRGGPASGARPL